MSDNKAVNTDFAEAAVALGCFAILILTSGDPDLLDALIHYLMQAKP